MTSQLFFNKQIFNTQKLLAIMFSIRYFESVGLTIKENICKLNFVT